jgi:uncharacterized membrane protein (UPF0127 family)
MTVKHALIVAALLCAPFAHADTELDADFARTPLVVDSNGLGCYFFDTYLALSRAQQTRGLMFVRELPESVAMIFIYREAGIRSMWMKNTYIPLDILFIDVDGSVVSAAEHTEPLSLESIQSAAPAIAVLEINAGLVEKFRLGPGSRVLLSDIILPGGG